MLSKLIEENAELQRNRLYKMHLINLEKVPVDQTLAFGFAGEAVVFWHADSWHGLTWPVRHIGWPTSRQIRVPTAIVAVVKCRETKVRHVPLRTTLPAHSDKKR